MRKKTLIITGIVAVALLTISVAVGKYYLAGNKGAQIPTVETSGVSKKQVETAVNTSGTVRSEHSAKITTALTSNVKEIYVKPGDKVKKGDPLCDFDDSMIKTELEAARKNLKTAQALNENQNGVNRRSLENAKEEQDRQLNKADSDIRDAQDAQNNARVRADQLKDQLEEQKKALEVEKNAQAGITDETQKAESDARIAAIEGKIQSLQADIESANNEANAAKKQIKDLEASKESIMASAKQQVQAAQDAINTAKLEKNTDAQETEVKKLEANLKNATILAPFDGTVTSISAEEGSPVTGNTVMVIEDTETIHITARIKEFDILKIKEGMKAKIILDALGSDELVGKVSKIYMTPIKNGDGGNNSGQGSAAEYEIEITLDQKNSNVLIGMNAKVKIILEEGKGGYTVPYSAVTEGEDGNSYLYAAVPSEGDLYQVRKIPVTKGLENDYYVEVHSDQLTEDMQIVNSPETVSEGMKVQIQPVDTLAGIPQEAGSGGQTEAAASDDTAGASNMGIQADGAAAGKE